MLYCLLCLTRFQGRNARAPRPTMVLMARSIGECEILTHVLSVGLVCLLVRFLGIKQDPRIERPAGRGDGDWSVIGGIPGSKWCILKWVNLLNGMHGQRPDKDGPMFLNKDRQRPYTYGNFSRDYDFRQRRVGLEDADITHPHGIRVWAYNKVRELLGRGIAAAHGGWAQPVGRSNTGGVHGSGREISGWG